MSELSHILDIKVIRYDLYNYNIEKAKKTKRGSFDVFYSPGRPGVYMFETWGYKHGKGFGQFCSSYAILEDKIRERLQKKNLNTYQRDQWELRKSFPKTTEDAKDCISAFEMIKTIEEVYLKDMASESSLRAAKIYTIRTALDVMPESPAFQITADQMSRAIDAVFKQWLPLGSETPPLMVVEPTPKPALNDTSKLSEEWGAW